MDSNALPSWFNAWSIIDRRSEWSSDDASGMPCIGNPALPSFIAADSDQPPVAYATQWEVDVSRPDTKPFAPGISVNGPIMWTCRPTLSTKTPLTAFNVSD